MSDCTLNFCRCRTYYVGLQPRFLSDCRTYYVGVARIMSVSHVLCRIVARIMSDCNLGSCQIATSIFLSSLVY